MKTIWLLLIIGVTVGCEKRQTTTIDDRPASGVPMLHDPFDAAHQWAAKTDGWSQAHVERIVAEGDGYATLVSLPDGKSKLLTLRSKVNVGRNGGSSWHVVDAVDAPSDYFWPER